MTFREYVAEHQPHRIIPTVIGGVIGCPHYLIEEDGEEVEPYDSDECICYTFGNAHERCAACWDQELPEGFIRMRSEQKPEPKSEPENAPTPEPVPKSEEDWFGIVRWCDSDLENALERYGLEPNDEMIGELRRRCDTHHLEDCMIAAGWDYIDYTISEMEREGAFET